MSDNQPTSLDGLMTRYTLQSDVRKGDEIVHCLDDRAKAALNRLLIQERIDELEFVRHVPINHEPNATPFSPYEQRMIVIDDRIAQLQSSLTKGEG